MPRMFAYVAAAAAVLAASPVFAKPATPAQLELQTWRAFKAKDVGEIRSLFAPDFVGVYADGTHDLARELQSLQHVTIQDYRLLRLSSRTVGADDVLLTYAADLHALVDAKPTSQRLWMASLWHRQGGRWLCVYHTEIKAK
ncbi:MAG: nuclear transport factor 2 family protein [Sphingomicrobium sp.]